MPDSPRPSQPRPQPTGEDNRCPKKPSQMCEYVAAHPDNSFELRFFLRAPSFEVGRMDVSPVDKPSKLPILGIGVDSKRPDPVDRPAHSLSVLSELPRTLQNAIGMMFYDRVRYRFAGVTIGEHLTTLALAPREEITLSQRSMTQFEESFESSSEVEQERERTFEGVFSTDVSNTIIDEVALSLGGNLGANIGATVKGFTVGGSAGGSGALDVSHSETLQVDAAQELTYAINRRLRQAHKITLSTTESSMLEAGTVRRLTNHNLNRPVQFRIYRLYNKRRIALERYDAKLCLRVALRHPYDELLTAIKSGLDALDPFNEANYNCKLPPTKAEQPIGTRKISWPDPLQVDNAWELNPVSFVTSEIIDDVQSIELNITPDDSTMTLVDLQIQIVKYEKREPSHDIAGQIDTFEVDDPAQFYSEGGQISWDWADNIETKHPGSRKVRITANKRPQSSILAGLQLANSWWCHAISLQVTAKFAQLNDVEREEYQNCVERERIRLAEALSAEAVVAVVQREISQMPTTIMRHVVQQLIRSMYPAAEEGLPINYLVSEFRHFFDWNEAVIQPLESWLDPIGYETYQDVVDQINNLAPSLDPAALLPTNLGSTLAEVFIPIKPTREQDVLRQATVALRIGDWDLATYASAFAKFRSEEYGPIKRSIANQDEWDRPCPTRATDTTACEWENEWEKARSRRRILDEWSDTTPTDGIHIEPILSDCESLDEWTRADLPGNSDSPDNAVAPDDAVPREP